MTSWPAESFPSPHDHDTDRQTSWNMPQRFERQNAFILEPNDPYNPFDGVNIQLSDDSSSSSFSSIHSAVSKTLLEDNHSDNLTNTQQHKTTFRRVPMPQNTGDYDEPIAKTTHTSPPPIIPTTIQYLSFIWSGHFCLMLQAALWVLAFSVIYQALSCTELQHMPTERLYAVDPDAPTHVWVPVFQWTCWNHTWIGQCSTLALWILGATFGLAWLHWKRR